jgi:hypothetical protein
MGYLNGRRKSLLWSDRIITHYQKTRKREQIGIPGNRGKGVECLEKATPQGVVGRT